MAEEKIKLSKRDRLNVAWRNTFAQGSWNYERMQNGGFVYAMIPAIKKLYSDKEDRKLALQRHLEFYNTHPYLTAPVLGVTLAMEEERASGAPIDDVAIQGVKIGMMGPLAGVGDPVFWFTVRPMLGALGASLALGGNIMGPIIFFVAWNIIRWAFLWYTQEFGYKAGSAITDDLSGGLLQDVTRGASILGMFVLASLVERWVNIDFQPVVSRTPLQEGAYVDWDSISMSPEGLQSAFQQVEEEGRALSSTEVTTLQDNLDELIPGLAGLLLTFLCMWLLRKNVSPIIIILGLFVFGVVVHVIGLL
ncbi:MAG: PTS system mannose/fructose/sorbose family transporter subunit IID [Tetragenococcus halophilus]|nr:PTS system mannose/fructose/sorbose family transporter subunit IID [Tetragenococcus halophilus]